MTFTKSYVYDIFLLSPKFNGEYSFLPFTADQIPESYLSSVQKELDEIHSANTGSFAPRGKLLEAFADRQVPKVEAAIAAEKAAAEKAAAKKTTIKTPAPVVEEPKVEEPAPVVTPETAEPKAE